MTKPEKTQPETDQNASTTSHFKVTQTENIYQGRIISLRRDTITEPNGTTYKREVVEHPGAIVIVPVDNDGKLLLVKQWRHAAGKTLTELPAGTLEKGEPPRDCAERECQEETGFKPNQLIELGGFFSAPGFCTEYLHLFLASELVASPLPGDEDEHIELHPVTLEQAIGLIENGTICDAKSVAGILRYKLYQERATKSS